MKTAWALAAAAGLAAASPLAGRSSSSFSLRAFTPSTNGPLDGMFATELHSTNDGTTPVILNATDATLRMAQMSFLPPSSVMVNYPLRAGGSEPDFLTPAAVDPATNMSLAQVVPAGYGAGFSVQNATAGGAAVQVLQYSSGGAVAQMLACSAATMNGTQNVTVQLLQFWFGAGDAPAGCSAVQLQIV